MNPFKVLIKGLGAIFGLGNKDLRRDYEQAVNLARLALDAVKIVANATANKRDDALIEALAPYITRPVTLGMVRSAGSLEGLLRLAARGVMQAQFTGLAETPPDRILNLAIELAYAAFRRGE